MDFSREDQIKKLHHLIKECHVFLQGYRYGCLDKYGLSVNELTDLNPHLIYTQINAYGLVLMICICWAI